MIPDIARLLLHKDTRDSLEDLVAFVEVRFQCVRSRVEGLARFAAAT
jgi:hypothetical protein